jgi:hypothetical protein
LIGGIVPIEGTTLTDEEIGREELLEDEVIAVRGRHASGFADNVRDVFPEPFPEDTEP